MLTLCRFIKICQFSTAQPSKEELDSAEHFLYSYLNYDQDSSVSDWLKQVKIVVEESFIKNLTPVIVGGTGMYISKLINGINKIPQISDQAKQQSQEIFDNLGASALIEEMQKLGLDQNEIKFTDKQRLIRQYQVLLETGKPISHWHSQPKHHIIDPNILTHINIEIDRQMLYDKCNDRFVKMLELGAIEEVKELFYKIGDNSNYQVSKTLGYFEIRDYLKNILTKDQMIDLATQKIRNYAKRQLTWFRHQFENKNIFDSNNTALKFILSKF